MSEQGSIKQKNERERPFSIEQLFFSTTDIHGKITSWNDTFAKISGYAISEISGAPHSLIRHTDMPRAVFQLLWDTIQSGKPIGAYVKNRAKDGSFYWVYALAMPISTGYLSIRLKPSQTFLPLVENIYDELLKYENDLLAEGCKKTECAQKSKINLLQKLNSLGFLTYESFMELTLPVELSERNKALTFSKGTSVSEFNTNSSLELYARVVNIREHLTILFNQFFLSLDLSKKIREDFACVQDLGNAIMIGSLNASIEAARYGEVGRVLHVLADYLGTCGNKIIGELKDAEVRCHDSLAEVSKMLFMASSALLQTEIFLDFLKGENDDDKVQSIDRTATLMDCFSASITELLSNYSKLESAMLNLLGQFEEIQKLFLSLKVAQVSAKAEANRLLINTNFRNVFDQVYAFVDSAKDTIGRVNNDIEQYVSSLQTKSYSQASIAERMVGMKHA